MDCEKRQRERRECEISAKEGKERIIEGEGTHDNKTHERGGDEEAEIGSVGGGRAAAADSRGGCCSVE